MMKYTIILALMVLFNIKGISVTKTALRTEELNKEITSYIIEQFPGYTIHEAYKVNNNGVISFEIIICKKAEKVILYFTRDNIFIKQKKIIVSTEKKKGIQSNTKKRR